MLPILPWKYLLNSWRRLHQTSRVSGETAEGLKKVDVHGTGSPVLGQATGTPARTDAAVDVRNWTFSWSFEAMARTEPATAAGFAKWLYEQGQTELTRRTLTSLYAEYVEANELRPLRWHAFDRSLKAAGIVRHRSSLPGRPWLYRIAPPHSAIVYKLDRAMG